jgi:hypothetical protein
MDSPREPEVTPVSCVASMARAQAEIRALTTLGRPLSAVERLELARWQRVWVAAWKVDREQRYVIAA